MVSQMFGLQFSLSNMNWDGEKNLSEYFADSCCWLVEVTSILF